MSEPRNADEWVAAFLDGRLDERQRAEMLARLAANDEAYRHFAATAAVLREAEETEAEETEDADAGAAADDDGVDTFPAPRLAGAPVLAVVRSADEADEADEADAPELGPDHEVTRLHPGKRALAVWWLALAAGIVGLALAGRALWPRTSSAGEPVSLAERLAHVDQGLPAEWNRRPPWTSRRGDGGSEVLSPEEKAAAAARAGALLVDLSVAVRGRDAVRTRVLAEQIRSRFDPRAGRNGALRRISAGAGGAPERLEPLVSQATGRIARRLGREALELGAWIEAARLAAACQDTAFFRDRATRPTLDRLVLRTATDPPGRAAVDRVRLLLAEADPPRWDALADALLKLSREIASG